MQKPSNISLTVNKETSRLMTSLTIMAVLQLQHNTGSSFLARQLQRNVLEIAKFRVTTPKKFPFLTRQQIALPWQ